MVENKLCKNDDFVHDDPYACDMQTAAKASIWLASKIEENVRRVRDVINVFNFLENQRDGKNTDVSQPSHKLISYGILFSQYLWIKIIGLSNEKL